MTAATFTRTFPAPHLRQELIACAQVLASPIIRAVSSALRAGPGVEQMLGEDAPGRHSHLAGGGGGGSGDRRAGRHGQARSSLLLIARSSLPEPHGASRKSLVALPAPPPNTRTPQKMLSSQFRSTKPEPPSLCGGGGGGGIGGDKREGPGFESQLPPAPAGSPVRWFLQTRFLPRRVGLARSGAPGRCRYGGPLRACGGG